MIRNLIKENHKKIKTQLSLEDIDLPEPSLTETDDDAAADTEECLQLCLQKLSADKREMILGYYAKEKQAKIDHRNELARKFGKN